MPRKKAPQKVPKPAKPRRARGTGSIMKDARRGGYLARVPVGRVNGRTKYVEVRAPTQAEVIEKMKAVRPPDPNTITVREWAARWLSGLSVRTSTLDGYKKQIYARIIPTLGDAKLASVAVSDIRVAQVKWAEDGTATANRTRAVGATMMRAAMLDGLVSVNPFALCPKLKYEPKPLNPLSPAELRAVIAGYTLASAGPLLAFLAATGARIGEAAALDVGDYSRETGRVSITKTWTLPHGTRAPKSRHSRRTITVPEPARPAILAALGDRTSGPLFPTAEGTRFSSSVLHHANLRQLKRLKIEPRNPHSHRHGVATLLVSRGVPLGDVARYLGHTVAQVVRTYVHAAGTDPAETLTSAFV